MPPGGIRTHNLSRRAADDLRLRPRGHWDRHKLIITIRKKGCKQLYKNHNIVKTHQFSAALLDP